ncbi:hypothetical protein [Larkinella rosea]|uniref:Uncharacterized protein n=1 Tax=Larkinella rosea TaxID=2025312 RepID=A0A3P1BIK8_9BACT|nr:hypothetical protein [Larkinella rosea]RRB00868.1 hypothetical protein EHT25_22005 [Larkinella rosea]
MKRLNTYSSALVWYANSWNGTVQVFEVSPDKKVVWALSSWKDPDLDPATSCRISTGLVIGLLGFTTFLFLQSFLLNEFSVAVSFGLAFIVNTGINLIANRVF